jgi:hypothetical protein
MRDDFFDSVAGSIYKHARELARLATAGDRGARDELNILHYRVLHDASTRIKADPNYAPGEPPGWEDDGPPTFVNERSLRRILAHMEDDVTDAMRERAAACRAWFREVRGVLKV